MSEMYDDQMYKDASPFKTALKWGLIAGGLFALLSLILYLTGNMMDTRSSWTILIQIAIVIFTVIMAIREHRDQDLGGRIEYGRGVGTGTLTIFFASVVSGIVTILLIEVIDPGLKVEMMNTIEEGWREQEMTEEEIEQARDFTKFLVNGYFSAFISVLMLTLIGLITSLISSSFQQTK